MTKEITVYQPKQPARRPRHELAKSRLNPVEYLTEQEYIDLQQVVPENKPEHRLLIRLLWETGLRCNEALTLTRSQIYPDKINILKGKGNKQRFVAAQVGLLGDLIRYQETHGQPRIFQLITTETGALYMLRRYGKKANLQKRIYPHLFRHSFAINFLRQTGNIYALQEIGGWSDLETIKIYMRMAIEQSQEAMNRMTFPKV